MDRRGFLKGIGGFVAGVCGAKAVAGAVEKVPVAREVTQDEVNMGFMRLMRQMKCQSLESHTRALNESVERVRRERRMSLYKPRKMGQSAVETYFVREACPKCEHWMLSHYKRMGFSPKPRLVTEYHECPSCGFTSTISGPTFYVDDGFERQLRQARPETLAWFNAVQNRCSKPMEHYWVEAMALSSGIDDNVVVAHALWPEGTWRVRPRRGRRMSLDEVIVRCYPGETIILMPHGSRRPQPIEQH